MYTCACVCECAWLRVCVHGCTNLYTHLNTQIGTHTHTHTHTRLFLSGLPSLGDTWDGKQAMQRAQQVAQRAASHDTLDEAATDGGDGVADNVDSVEEEHKQDESVDRDSRRLDDGGGGEYDGGYHKTHMYTRAHTHTYM